MWVQVPPVTEMTKMAYELYKKRLSMEDFFAQWKSDDPENLSEKIKNRIYDKYLLQCKILQRDNFKCQNEECEFPDSPLTIHHIKHQRNFTDKEKCTRCGKISKSWETMIKFVNTHSLLDYGIYCLECVEELVSDLKFPGIDIVEPTHRKKEIYFRRFN